MLLIILKADDNRNKLSIQIENVFFRFNLAEETTTKWYNNDIISIFCLLLSNWSNFVATTTEMLKTNTNKNKQQQQKIIILWKPI